MSRARQGGDIQATLYNSWPRTCKARCVIGLTCTALIPLIPRTMIVRICCPRAPLGESQECGRGRRRRPAVGSDKDKLQGCCSQKPRAKMHHQSGYLRFAAHLPFPELLSLLLPQNSGHPWCPRRGGECSLPPAIPAKSCGLTFSCGKGVSSPTRLRLCDSDRTAVPVFFSGQPHCNLCWRRADSGRQKISETADRSATASPPSSSADARFHAAPHCERS